MSTVALMQVAVLSQYPLHVMRSRMVCAVTGMLSRTPWDTPLYVQWVTFIVRRLPQDIVFSAAELSPWLQRHAVWCGGAYASWHLRHAGACDEWCGDWPSDTPALQLLAGTRTVPSLVGWGAHRGRGVQ